MSEHVLNFVLVKKYLIYTLYMNRDTYEGDSICNEIVSINQKVLCLYALQLHSQNRSVTWLYNCKIAVMQLISNIAQSAFKKGYVITLRYELKQ